VKIAAIHFSLVIKMDSTYPSSCQALKKQLEQLKTSFLIVGSISLNLNANQLLANPNILSKPNPGTIIHLVVYFARRFQFQSKDLCFPPQPKIHILGDF